MPKNLHSLHRLSSSLVPPVQTYPQAITSFLSPHSNTLQRTHCPPAAASGPVLQADSLTGLDNSPQTKVQLYVCTRHRRDFLQKQAQQLHRPLLGGLFLEYQISSKFSDHKNRQLSSQSFISPHPPQNTTLEKTMSNLQAKACISQNSQVIQDFLLSHFNISPAPEPFFFLFPWPIPHRN